MEFSIDFVENQVTTNMCTVFSFPPCGNLRVAADDVFKGLEVLPTGVTVVNPDVNLGRVASGDLKAIAGLVFKKPYFLQQLDLPLEFEFLGTRFLTWRLACDCQTLCH